MTRKRSVQPPATESGANPPAPPASRRPRTVAKPTKKQQVEFAALLASPQFTEAERTRLHEWGETQATGKTMYYKINWLKVERWRRTPHDAAAYAQEMTL